MLASSCGVSKRLADNRLPVCIAVGLGRTSSLPRDRVCCKPVVLSTVDRCMRIVCMGCIVGPCDVLVQCRQYSADITYSKYRNCCIVIARKRVLCLLNITHGIGNSVSQVASHHQLLKSRTVGREGSMHLQRATHAHGLLACGVAIFSISAKHTTCHKLVNPVPINPSGHYTNDATMPTMPHLAISNLKRLNAPGINANPCHTVLSFYTPRSLSPLRIRTHTQRLSTPFGQDIQHVSLSIDNDSVFGFRGFRNITPPLTPFGHVTCEKSRLGTTS